MKENKRLAVKSALLKAGFAGVTRAEFEADRLRFGTAWIRRCQELEADYIIEKRLDGQFITHWTLIGSRNRQPEAAVKERWIPMGSVLGWEFFEVAA